MLALAALLIQAPPQQFDLVCAGTKRRLSQFVNDSAPFATRIRIDLQRGEWCEGDCGAVEPFAEVQPASFTLRRSSGYSEALGYNELSITIDRTTGAYLGFSSSRGAGSMSTIEWRASCEPRPFSGFPEVRTRF